MPPVNQHEDIFLSYAREDRVVAEKIVGFLEDNGWSVSWDRVFEIGVSWPAALEDKLRNVKCVVVLWTEASRDSRWVWEEANFGLSRSALASVRLANVDPPMGFQSVQAEDLTGWTGQRNHAGLSRLFARVRNLLQDVPAPGPRLSPAVAAEMAKQQPTASHFSVSDMRADKDCILAAVHRANREALDEVAHGYDQLADAQREARLALDDQAPLKHFAAAASNFQVALSSLGSEALSMRLPERNNMPVEYFLKMEYANALVFSQPNPKIVPDGALEIYRQLAERYPADTAIFLRMGQAKLRSAITRAELQAAVRDLNTALSLAPLDELVSERHWVYFEVPLKVGTCFWRIAELPNISPKKRVESMRLAVASTDPVIHAPRPDGIDLQFVNFAVIKALGNVLFFRSHLLRIGDSAGGTVKDIRAYISMLRGPDYREVYEKQTKIIDSVMFAAATVGWWEVAVEEATKNLANFREIAAKRPLDMEEVEMRSRADETQYFARKLIASKGLLDNWLQLGRSS